MTRQPTKPFRQNRLPVPYFRLNISDAGNAAKHIFVRICEIRRATGTGAFLFVNKDLDVYILPDTKTCAEQWVITYFTDLVGYYSYASKKGLPILKPTVDGIQEDIEDHLKSFSVDASIA